MFSLVHANTIANSSYDHLFQQTNTKTKDNKFLHTNAKLLSYRSVVTFVVPNLSHSDCLNLPVTVDNKLLATNKSVIFAYLDNKYGITYLGQHFGSSSSFLSINTTAF